MRVITDIFYLLGILVFLIQTDAATLKGEGIIEGDEPQPDEFLYQVAILSNEKIICGGGIIDDKYILTAAHCVIDNSGGFNRDKLTVIAGKKNLKNEDSEGVSVSVEKVYVPSEYDAIPIDTPADIAVLKLKGSLNLADKSKLKKLKLATDPKELYAGKNAKIAGFGWDWIRIADVFGTKNVEEVGGSTNRLKYLITDVLDSDDCQNIFGGTRDILDTHICAKSQQNHRRPSGICKGDSGGPLVYNDEVVIGIVSTSPFGCKETTLPAVYTRVSSYVNFIEKAMKNDVNNNIRHYIF